MESKEATINKDSIDYGLLGLDLRAFGLDNDIKAALNPNEPDPERVKTLALLRVSLHFAEQAGSGREIPALREEFKGFIDGFLAKAKEHVGVGVKAFLVLLGLFLRENWLGPSFFRDTAEKRLHRDQKEKLKTPKKPMFELDPAEEILGVKPPQGFEPNRHTLRFVKSKEFASPKERVLEALGSEGEPFPRQIAFPHVFMIVRELAEVLGRDLGVGMRLWRARVLFLHNRMLNGSPLLSFRSEVVPLYESVLKDLQVLCPEEKALTAMICVEFSYVLGFYYKYGSANKVLEKASDLLGVELVFTGKEGYRTKYQQFTVPILVMERKAKKPVSEGVPEEEEKSLIPTIEPIKDEEETIKNDENSDIPQTSTFLPTVVPLEPESILLEQPRFVSQTSAGSEPKPLDHLSLEEQLLALAFLSHLLKSRAFDEVLSEQLSAGLSLILAQSHSWISTSQALLMRSKNEFPSYKRRDRSLAQMGVLVDQFNDSKPLLFQRMAGFFYGTYPWIGELQKAAAEMYMQNGNVLSSCEIFRKIDMMEECAECLAFAGLVKEAKETALDLLKANRETPKLLCILGELFNDAQYYKKAWKTSNKRFVRAQRSLARFYFYTAKRQEKAVRAFQKVLKINPFDSNSQFTLGCIQMGTGDSESAVRAFTAVVQIQESNAEAWGNLSACFLQLGRKKEAFSCIQQAVKFNENNWKLWANHMRISLELRKFSSFLESVRRLIELEQKNLINLEVLAKTRQVFSYFAEKARLGQVERRKVEFYREGVERTLKFAGEKLGEKWEAWDQLAEYYRDFSEYQVSGSKPEEDPVDLKPTAKVRFAEGVEDKPQGKAQEKQGLLLLKAFESRLKSCQCLMIAGWEADKALAETLNKQVKALVADFQALREKDRDWERIRFFVETVNSKLAKTLENVELAKI